MQCDFLPPEEEEEMTLQFVPWWQKILPFGLAGALSCLTWLFFLVSSTSSAPPQWALPLISKELMITSSAVVILRVEHAVTDGKPQRHQGWWRLSLKYVWRGDIGIIQARNIKACKLIPSLALVLHNNIQRRNLSITLCYTLEREGYNVLSKNIIYIFWEREQCCTVYFWECNPNLEIEWHS